MTPLDPDMVREIDRLERRVLAVEVVPIRIGVIEAELAGIKDDIGELRRKIEDRAREREVERRDAAKDARANRKWQVGTALTTVLLIISAVAVLLQAFGGSP